MQDARELVDEEENGPENESARKRKHDPELGKRPDRSLDISMAQRLLAKCRTEEQNRQYNNPPYGQLLCTCDTCTRHPPAVTPSCLCSGCQPGMSRRDMITAAKDFIRCVSADAAEVALARGIGVPLENEESVQGAMIREDQELVCRYLTELDSNLYINSVANPGGLYTPGMFVPTPVINMVIDNFFDLDTPHKFSVYLTGFQPFAES
ncbi:hypothetical protein QCA50_018052 [Cerrena zonata]|uniref:Uncharacterized protein n=1 Tax=Cerrena zonata TaxID=2478898 RepID=A0AAW0FNP9_9APHY